MADYYIRLPSTTGGGSSGVSSVNSLTGALSLVGGDGIVVNSSGTTITVSEDPTYILPVVNGGTGTNNGSITGTGELDFTAGGSDQNIVLTPSGSGATLLGPVAAVGTVSPVVNMDVANFAAGNFQNIMLVRNGGQQVSFTPTQVNCLYATAFGNTTTPQIFGGGNPGDSLLLGSTESGSKGVILIGYDGSNVGIGAFSANVPLAVHGASSGAIQTWENAFFQTVANIDFTGKLTVQEIATPPGTDGDQTIDAPSGTVNFAAAATSLTVTNATVTASSIVFAIVMTDDATAVVKNVVPTTGSFTINLTAAATAETAVGFIVFN